MGPFSRTLEVSTLHHFGFGVRDFHNVTLAATDIFGKYPPGYDIWELYAVSVVELIKTTIIGVFAVSGVSLILIPLWSAPLFVLPFIILLYIDLLGWIQIMGLEINAGTLDAVSFCALSK